MDQFQVIGDAAGYGNTSWRSIPTNLLLAELSRRADDSAAPKPQCGSGQRGTYDTLLHVGALILILVLSTLTCAFPLFSRPARGRKPSTVVFICQHFGTGVLIATAFVHLLPTAFVSLTNPCLPYVFSKGYKPMAGLIAMVSALVVIALESYLTTRGAGHSHSHDLWDEDDADSIDGTSSKLHSHNNGSLAARRGSSHRPRNIALEDLEASEGLVAGVSPLPESTPTNLPNGRGSGGIPKFTDSNGISGEERSDEEDDRESLDLELDLNELDPVPPASDTTHLHSRIPAGPHASHTRGASSATIPHIPNPDEQKRLLLQCLLLEAGILFHSIFIGMALSVATGPSFVVFLIAIAFHQSFEGLALGSRIAAIQFPRSSPRPWLMVLAYGTTTPLGQAIGLFVHNFYDPMSQTGLLMVGFMNAISSGLLLFAGLVQLLAEDFLTEKSYKTLRGRRRVHALLAVVGGAGLMAAVGALA